MCSVQYKCVTDAQKRKTMLPGRGLEYIDRSGEKHKVLTPQIQHASALISASISSVLPDLQSMSMSTAPICADIHASNPLRLLQAIESYTFVAADGVLMPLEEGTSAFITMNPGYIGRAELPESLKVTRAFHLMSVLSATWSDHQLYLAAVKCASEAAFPALARPSGSCMCFLSSLICTDMLTLSAGLVPAHHCGGARPTADHGEHAHGRRICGGQNACQEVCIPLLPAGRPAVSCQVSTVV